MPASFNSPLSMRHFPGLPLRHGFCQALGMLGLFEEITEQSASPLSPNKIPVFAGLSCIIARRNGPTCSRPMPCWRSLWKSLWKPWCACLGFDVLR